MSAKIDFEIPPEAKASMDRAMGINGTDTPKMSNKTTKKNEEDDEGSVEVVKVVEGKPKKRAKLQSVKTTEGNLLSCECDCHKYEEYKEMLLQLDRRLSKITDQTAVMTTMVKTAIEIFQEKD